MLFQTCPSLCLSQFLLPPSPAGLTDIVAPLNFVFHLFQYRIYREIRFGLDSDNDEENDAKDEDIKGDEKEVREYSMLVGEKISNKMLLYRS